MPLYDSFGRPLDTAPAGPPLTLSVPKKKKTPPKNIPRKHRRSIVGAQHQQQARMVTVALAAVHNVNGAVYGPGTVTVRRDLADALLEGERNAAAADANFAGTKACVIGPGFKTIRVPPEYFDIAQQNAVPFETISKQGVLQRL